MSDIAQPATQEYLLARGAETLPSGVVWLRYQNHLVKSNDDPALVEKVVLESTPGLLNREQKISRSIYPRDMAHGNINDSFLEDELRLIYEALFIRNVFVMENIKSDIRVFRAANRAGLAATQSET